MQLLAWPLSFSKILKKFLGPIQSYEDVPFLGPKRPICHKQKFFGTNHYCYFHLLVRDFHCAKFKKSLIADPELGGCAFLGPKSSICLDFFFFLKTIKIILIHLLARFIVQNFKKILPVDPEL